MSAQCSKCRQAGTWTGSSGTTTNGDGIEQVTDTYECPSGHSWTSTVTYE